MAPLPARPALAAQLLLLLLSVVAAEDNTTVTTPSDVTTDAAKIWVKMPSNLKISLPYEEWMANSSTLEYQTLADNVLSVVKPPVVAEFQDAHVVTEVKWFDKSLGKTKAYLSTIVKTNHTVESEIPINDLEDKLDLALSFVKTVVTSPVTATTIKRDNFQFIQPFTTPEQTDTTRMESTVREKRSTTAMNETTTTGADSTTAASAAAEDTASEAATTEAAATEAAATEAAATEAVTTGAAATESTATEAAATEEAATGAAATEVAATEVAATEVAAANATDSAAANATETPDTTTASTTTEASLPLAVTLTSQVRITSMHYEEFMGLPFTEQYQNLVGKMEYTVKQALMAELGDNYINSRVKDLKEGSVIANIEVTVMTDKTNPEDVDGGALASETTAALQTLVDESDFTFDPEGVKTSDEVQIIEPTTTPAPTEDPYQFTILKLTMRAPFVNWTDGLNDTDTQAFAEINDNVHAGVDLMVSKKYPKRDWNVSSEIVGMANDTVDGGLFISFLVAVEPQMTNTSSIIRELAKNFFYFNTLGNLKITPTSVRFKDLTTYAPGRGVVIMDEDYLRQLRKNRFNGSYVGDFTTQPPTLQPIIKRHDSFVVGIAVPAFIGMLAAIGVLLICTTIAGAKKSDD